MIVPSHRERKKAEKELASKLVDHLGLVAGICKELQIAQIIDSCIPNESADQIVSTGTGVVAMILNGLGFVNKRLYMVSNFFENKPIAKLLEVPYLKSEHLNDDTLGRLLDRVYQYGVSELYSQVSSKVLSYLQKEYALKSEIGQLDNSTIHMHGTSYEGVEQGEGLLEIRPGYSKDNRPDLNQVGIQLIVEHKSRIPMLFKVLSGNHSESKSYRQTIHQHISGLQEDVGLKWIVADSKLYTAATLSELSAHPAIKWLTKVPQTIAEVNQLKQYVNKSDLQAIADLPQYSYLELGSTYGELAHRWLLIHSKEKEQQDLKQLNKRIDKKIKAEEKGLKKLMRQAYDTPQLAFQALAQFASQLKYQQIEEVELLPKNKYAKAGKPTKGQVPTKTVYQVQTSLSLLTQTIAELRDRQGYYIMATNELDGTKLDVQLIMATYKQQASVERGFRFLKDPMMMGTSLFLQKTQRIMALLMIMTLCLLVYSALEFKIRTLLQQQDKTVKDRLGKPTQKPSLRWIFETFEGIHQLYMGKKSLILNLKPKHHIILDLLGPNYWKYYA